MKDKLEQQLCACEGKITHAVVAIGKVMKNIIDDPYFNITYTRQLSDRTTHLSELYAQANTLKGLIDVSKMDR